MDTEGLDGDITITFHIPSVTLDDGGGLPDRGDAQPRPACDLPAWQGQFHAMNFDTTENRLRFTFGIGGSDFPISFDLWRVCAE